MRWRGARASALIVPEPWPGRVDAFMVACARHAGEREEDLFSVLKGLAGGVD